MIYKVFKVASKTLLRYHNILSLFSLYRNDLLMKVYRIALIKLVYKISSMMIMFIPIKIFIVIASGSSISYLSGYQDTVAFDLTLVLLFSSLLFIYLINLASQFLIPKFINNEKNKFRGVVEVFYRERTYPRNFIRKCYGNVINFLSDFMLVLVCLVVVLYISIDFAFIYILILLFFYMLVEYLVLTDNRFDFLTYIGLGEVDFINICASLNFLLAFASVFWVYYNSGMEIHDGVLLLMTSRLANSGVKGLAVSSLKISQHYNQMMIK